MNKTDFKLVCIIDTYSDSKNVFFATGKDDDTNGLAKGIKKMSTTEPYLIISKAGGYKLLSNLEQEKNWDILLIYDKNTNENIAKSGAFVNFLPENSLVMWHENAGHNGFLTKENLNDCLKDGKIKKYLAGMHDTQPYNGYAKLSFLIDAWDDTVNKFKSQDYDKAKEELVKWFRLNEKLNKALEFLHGSLGGKHALTSILTDGAETFELSQNYKIDKVEQALGKWIIDLEGKKDDEYNIALAIVRDALLEQAGVTGEN